MESSGSCDSAIKIIFNEFRDLLDKLEARVKQREEQLKKDVKAQLLSSLESIFKSHLSEIADERSKNNFNFLDALLSKLGTEEVDCQRENRQFDTSDIHSDANSISQEFADFKKRVETTSPFSPNSGTTTDSNEDAYSHCHTPEMSAKCDTVTQMVVPLNPTQFIGEPFKSDDELNDSEETEKTMVPEMCYRQAVKKRKHYQIPFSMVNNSNQCPICFQNFSQRNSLNRHIRSHTGERPFPCSYCGKRFIDKERLKVHIRIHTGEKPFSCDICGRHFTQKSTVKRHMSVHTGAKPHNCEYCGKRFGSKDNLKVHIKSHTRIDHIVG
ncbi:gastrula zinc finger protein XlCGF57.1-like protein [Leptotrombidium deliense]|uniref:Gastrula zinc finger protein XlCGF57.1-like protein n=1 Tax=Leptotrombidium deliense TaxID=299467 RepID=A0A443SPJ6_9ACAR|nr:gastrula zinc finger protein XlCGF57.1-like protein [Leptotrombidium deliense]